ncbi:MAG: hypothetical protein GY772_06805 [bacterium]|nr:hypothetical protein [bacterium]
MSYAPTSLGYTLSIKTPVGTQKVTIPLEQIAKSAATAAMNAAWPVVEQKVMASVPKLLDQVVARGKAEIPDLLDIAFARAKPPLHKEEKRLLEAVDKKSDEIMKEATTRGLILAGGLSAVILGSAWWVGRQVKR